MAVGQVQKLKKPRKDTAVVQAPALNTKPSSGAIGIGGGQKAPKYEPTQGGQQSLRKSSGQGSSPGSGNGSSASGSGASGGSAPFPMSPRSFLQRQQADTAWGRVQGDTNYQRYLAALAYGDKDEIARYSGFAKPGEALTPPESAVDRIAREEALAQKNLAITRNENNTFFSGKNLDDIATIGNEAANNRKIARDEFLSALYTLKKAEDDAREAWKASQDDAGLDDEEAYNSTEPVPQASAPGAPAAKQTPKGQKPKGGTQAIKPTNPSISQAQTLKKKKK